jgi:hypothetical protein
MVLGAIVLILVQAGTGMGVNLYVTVPARHPGAHPSDYLGGSFDSVIWAITHGTLALAVHAALGLALALMVIGVAVRAYRLRHSMITTLSVLGGLFVLGAGFNGASFLDFNNNISSLLMALLAFAAIACYTIVLFLLEP